MGIFQLFFLVAVTSASPTESSFEFHGGGIHFKASKSTDRLVLHQSPLAPSVIKIENCNRAYVNEFWKQIHKEAATARGGAVTAKRKPSARESKFDS